jgi:hypothetical protein
MKVIIIGRLLLFLNCKEQWNPPNNKAGYEETGFWGVPSAHTIIFLQITHMLLCLWIQSLNLLRTIRAIFKEIYNLFCWPYEGTLFFKLEYSDSFTTNSGWLNSWILNTNKKPIHPFSTRKVHIHPYICVCTKIDGIPESTYLYSWDGWKHVALSKSPRKNCFTIITLSCICYYTQETMN